MLERKRIGEALKYYRTRKGLTLEEVGNHFDMTHKAVQFWENGRTSIKLTIFVELCKLYDVTPNQVLERAGY